MPISPSNWTGIELEHKRSVRSLGPPWASRAGRELERNNRLDLEADSEHHQASHL